MATAATRTMGGERAIDLHAHTTASDGDQTPTQLVECAKRAGLAALAVTDHDTTAGLAEAREAGNRLGVEIVAGIELSAAIDRGQCHLLGYLLDLDAPALNRRLAEVIANRNARNDKIVAKLQALGFAITLPEVAAVAGGNVIARPHFARVLIEKGYVASMQEAFDVYLAEGGKAYIRRDRLTPEEAIALVHDAGGLVSLAHPNNLKRGPEETASVIADLQAKGLDALEARYSQHTPDDTARYLALAARLGLLTTGGSDFHGPTVKPDVVLGHIEGDRPAPYALLAALKSKQAARY